MWFKKINDNKNQPHRKIEKKLCTYLVQKITDASHTHTCSRKFQ